MEKIITHRGEFLSRSDVLHRVELWRIGGAPVKQPEELRFEADEALVIEWKEVPKHEPLCSSSATLRLDSPGDRAYTHLYTITPGAVGMDVYRNGALYWTGTLDAEEYEEPYESAAHYTVSLTFGDFGIWQRLEYSYSFDRLHNGVETIGTLLHEALERGRLELPLDESLTAAASSAASSGLGVAKWLGCSPSNFFDEDGKAATLSDAIASLLQPLGLRLVQRAGRLWLYDLHGLHGALVAPPVEWSADSQTLSVDSVANNVRISFSPYASNKLLSSDDLKVRKPLHKVWSLLNKVGKGRDEFIEEWRHDDTYLYFSEQFIHADGGKFDNGDSRFGKYSLYRPAFLLGLTDNPDRYFGENTRLCRFLPIREGEETTAYCVKAPAAGAQVVGKGKLPTGNTGGVYTTRRVYLPKIPNPSLYCLRLRISILADRARCPLSTPADGTADKRARDEMDKDFGWAFLSVVIQCTDDKFQNVRYYYNNHTIKEKNSTASAQNVPREWRTSTNSLDLDHACLLAYFDKTDPSRHSALGGWRTNRNNIGQPNDDVRGMHKNGTSHMYDYENSLPDGELIPYPADGGWLTITVYNNLAVYPYRFSAYESNSPRPTALEWFAVKAPDLEVVRSWGDCEAPEVPDIEYVATLHPDAKEELSIETKCGTLPPEVEGEPVCRGLYLDAVRHCTVGAESIKRAGIVARPEQLLINSLYSQYATRHTKLSGEASIYDGVLAPRSEANQGAARFIVVEERQNLIEDCGEITAIELTPDIYKAVETEERL